MLSKRDLLILGGTAAGTRKLSSNEDFDPRLIAQSAEITRDFINNYHKRSEENHVFPRFKRAGKRVDLVDTFLRQHEAGRKLTETIIRLAPSSRANADGRRQLVASIESFITMYRPHAAREDTDLFPKLKEFAKIGFPSRRSWARSWAWLKRMRRLDHESRSELTMRLRCIVGAGRWSIDATMRE